MKELGLFVLKGMADELQNPAEDEQSRGIDPERMKEDPGHGKRQ